MCACKVFISAKRLPTAVDSAPQASSVLRRPSVRPKHLMRLWRKHAHIMTKNGSSSTLAHWQSLLHGYTRSLYRTVSTSTHTSLCSGRRWSELEPAPCWMHYCSLVRFSALIQMAAAVNCHFCLLVHLSLPKWCSQTYFPHVQIAMEPHHCCAGGDACLHSP